MKYPTQKDSPNTGAISLERMREVVLSNRCDGESEYAAGVAAANKNLLTFIDAEIERQATEHKPDPEGVWAGQVNAAYEAACAVLTPGKLKSFQRLSPDERRAWQMAVAAATDSHIAAYGIERAA